MEENLKSIRVASDENTEVALGICFGSGIGIVIGAIFGNVVFGLSAGGVLGIIGGSIVRLVKKMKNK